MATMPTKDDVAKAAATKITNSFYGRNLIPFTGGVIFVAYAFFWPEGYGHWLGTIVHAFRDAAGF